MTLREESVRRWSAEDGLVSTRGDVVSWLETLRDRHLTAFFLRFLPGYGPTDVRLGWPVVKLGVGVDFSLAAHGEIVNFIVNLG
ncbi:hypothetical protein AAVH_10851, partial [Aphelenchoides avenae]